MQKQEVLNSGFRKRRKVKISETHKALNTTSLTTSLSNVKARSSQQRFQKTAES
jgi:hypothetical protein